MKCRKQFFIIVLAVVAASVFAGVAAAQVPVCFSICPSNAQPGDLMTMTGYDENGELIDLSTVDIFESNIWGAALPDAPDDRFHTLGKFGDELLNIEIIDGSVVFELTEEMLSDAVTMWDYFGIPGEDDAAFRIAGEDGPFDTVAEAIAAGGTCSVSFGYTCGGESPRPSVPVDGATFVDPDVVLEWTPGAKAVTEDVYFDGALALEGTTETSYDPSPDGMLDWGTTYEWEVRDVNAAEPNSPFVGGPWTFTTEPFLYEIADQGRLAEDDGITASSTIEDSGPALTVEGLDGDIHGNNPGDMWLSDVEPGGTASIQYVFDAAYQLEELEIWNYNDSLEIIFGNGFADTVIEVSTDNGMTWTELTTVNLAQAPGEPTGPTDTLDLQGTIATALRLTAKSNHSGVNDQFGLSAVRIHYVPLRAMDPVPEPGETVEVDELMLEWRAGRKAATHLLYLGEDEDAVIEGTVTAVPLDEPGSAPEDLMLGQEYFWRVDEVNEAETPASLDGKVWSFVTLAYLTVDDFEGYDDECERIFFSWQDGVGHNGSTDCGVAAYSGNGTGSTVGNAEAPFAEQEITHDDSAQSMSLAYNNTGGDTSETTLSFDEPQDWTRSEVQALTFYVHGSEDNVDGQMYVKVNGDKQAVTVDLTEEDWQEVNVELASFTGANLQAVTSLTIGIENSGNGVAYIDNIRLYPSRCLAGSELRDDGDLNGDCIVDALDVAIVLDNWMGSGTPLVEYTFDSGLADSSGNGRDGVPVDGPVVADGILTLDGTNRVEIPFAENPFDGTQSWTIELEFQTTVGGAMLAMGPLGEDAEIAGRPLVYLGNEDTPGDWRWGFCGLWIQEGMSWTDGGGPWEDPTLEFEGTLYPQSGEWRSLVATFSSDAEAGVASGASWVDGLNAGNEIADLNWLYEDGIVPFDNSNDAVWIGMRPNAGVMEWLPVPTGGPYSGNLDNVRIYGYAVDSPDAERVHPGDVNRDNVVDQADLDIVEGNQGLNVLWP